MSPRGPRVLSANKDLYLFCVTAPKGFTPTLMPDGLFIIAMPDEAHNAQCCVRVGGSIKICMNELLGYIAFVIIYQRI